MKQKLIAAVLVATLMQPITAQAYPIESDGRHFVETGQSAVLDAYGNVIDPANTWGNTTWQGEKLTQEKGIIWGNGRYYTYYHQPMGGCFRLHADEIAPYTQADCWVSDDGVLYCGAYVCCAAYTPWFPAGTIVDTPYGVGLVVDYNGHCDLPGGTKADIDICTVWGREVPN